MLRVKEKVGVMPEVELDNYPSVLSGVARIDVDPSSGTVRVVPSVVDSCLAPPLCPGDALPEYRPSEIVYEGRRYILKEPLECEVTLEAGESKFFYGLVYEPFEVYASGDTLSEAIEVFAFKFDDRYEWYNEMASPGGPGLSARLEGIRQQMNKLVVSIEGER